MLLRRFAADLGLWYFGPGVFMALYVLKFGQPGTAVAPHLVLITLPLVGIFSTRLLIARFGGGRTTHVLGAAFLVSSLLAALWLYYFLVLVGLHSWGGVVAWNVIPTFFAQASVLADALGISKLLLFTALLLAYLGLSAACGVYFRRCDWTAAAARWMPLWMLWALLLSSGVLVAIEALQLASGVWVHAAEPLSLTLHPASLGLDLEGFRMNPVTASAMDQRQNAARRTYLAAIGKKNLVLIVVDALRPDHMNLYGYARDTTPNLSRIARERPTRTVVDVHASCGDTACALFSLFSSQSPADFSFHPFFLHEVLRHSGYRIHLLLSGDHTFFYGLKSFYGPVDTFYDGTQAGSRYLNDDQLVLDRLAGMPQWDGTPVMMQFHLMSAHILRKREDGPGVFEPAARYGFRDSRDTGPGAEALQSAVNFYDNGVLRADAVINDLLRTLQSKGYLKDTLVVVTADHGESLGEHGLFHHANSVREELLRIPLVLISYGSSATPLATSRMFPSQVDIAPTILSDLGLPRPDSWDGHPLQEDSAMPIAYFTEHSDAGLIDRSDPHNVWKYWREPSGQERAFNLSVDPHENSDRSGEIPAAQLSQWRALAAPEIQASLPVPR